jgi:hypothetical protein
MTADPSIFVKVPRHEHGLHKGSTSRSWVGMLAWQVKFGGVDFCRHAFSICEAYTPGYQSFFSFV